MRSDLATALRGRFTDYDLDLDGPSQLEELEAGVPELAMVSHPRGAHEYAIVYAPRMTMTDVTRLEREFLGSHRLLVLGPRIHERSAQMFRQLEVHYVDQAGNAYLDFDGVRIDVRGRRSEGTQVGASGAGTRGTNLFSTKRSQVIFVLLAWPELTDAPLRTLAHAAGVSLGQAQETLVQLNDAGYLEDYGHRRLRRGEELLDRWSLAFPAGLGAPSRQREFSGKFQDLRTLDDVSLVVSGEAALPKYLRPETLTVYVDEFTGKLAGANRWRADREPNIFIRTKFWRDPDGEPPPGSIITAPAALIYADLRSSHDSRQAEAAQWLRENDDRLQRL